jgi:hypothetical protein
MPIPRISTCFLTSRSNRMRQQIASLPFQVSVIGHPTRVP